MEIYGYNRIALWESGPLFRWNDELTDISGLVMGDFELNESIDYSPEKKTFNLVPKSIDLEYLEGDTVYDRIMLKIGPKAYFLRRNEPVCYVRGKCKCEYVDWLKLDYEDNLSLGIPERETTLADILELSNNLLKDQFADKYCNGIYPEQNLILTQFYYDIDVDVINDMAFRMAHFPRYEGEKLIHVMGGIAESEPDYITYNLKSLFEGLQNSGLQIKIGDAKRGVRINCRPFDSRNFYYSGPVIPIHLSYGNFNERSDELRDDIQPKNSVTELSIKTFKSVELYDKITYQGNTYIITSIKNKLRYGQISAKAVKQ